MRRLMVAARVTPTVTSVAIASIPIGVIVLILGDGASRALTVIGGSLPARALGLLLLAGGTCTVASIIRRDSFFEAVGAGCIAAGMAIYSASVFIGLRVQGLISGLLALSLAVGFLGRVLLLTSLAHRTRAP